jgi:hypothetical protein
MNLKYCLACAAIRLNTQSLESRKHITGEAYKVICEPTILFRRLGLIYVNSSDALKTRA